MRYAASQSMTPSFRRHVFADESALAGRLHRMLARLVESVGAVDRIACAIYDAQTDLLTTFVNSTQSGRSRTRHESPLAESPSLCGLAATGQVRVVDDLRNEWQTNAAHSRWLVGRGYRASFTVPLYYQGGFLGFVFFDSTRPAAFTPRVQCDLLVSCSLISMTIAGELDSVRSILASPRAARDFAEHRDFETGAHLERMARFSRAIACKLASRFGLDDAFVDHVFLFAPLHDVGKVSLPEGLLLKPGPLDPDERRIMRSHVARGTEIVDAIVNDFGFDDIPDASILRNIVTGHHELLDGSGYPQGLRGAEIPLEARIVAVADIFDALTSQRPYKEAWSYAESLAELRRMVDAGQLDRDCVAALAAETATIAEIGKRFADAD